MSMQTSLEEGIKRHRLAGIFPAQFFTEAGGHREAVLVADQRMVIRSYRDDLAGSTMLLMRTTFGGSRAAALIWITLA